MMFFTEAGRTGSRKQRILGFFLPGLLLILSLAACSREESGDPGPTITLLPTPVAEPLPATQTPTLPSETLPTQTSPAEAAAVAATENNAAPETSATPGSVFFPYIGEGPTFTPTVPPTDPPPPSPTATSTPLPPPTVAGAASTDAPTTPTPTPTRFTPVDFEAARAELAAEGRQLAYNKIGFHVTFLEDSDELDVWMQRLDEAGVPFFLKSVDNAEPLYKAQELMRASGVDHTLVYRSTAYDVPDYDLPPEEAAEAYWELEKAIWPPELDPDLVWFETMNELDKNRADWLAAFALRTAELALRDGYRWAAFGWASGEPEPSDWESPAMLELLRLIGEHPDQLAVALHEYSYLASDIGHDYPYKIGRFLDLFRAADEHGIPRPTVLITEWGWTYNNLPAEPDAMEDVTWAARLYGAYPQVKGAAIWNLGRLGDRLLPLNDQAQDLIDNMMVFSLDSYFSAPALPQLAPLDPAQFPPPK